MGFFDFFIYFMIGLFILFAIFMFYAKKRIDNNEPVFGSQRKQYEEEQGLDKVKGTSKKKKKSGTPDFESLKDFIGIKDIQKGIFEKDKNEYCCIVATDYVNFDLLNEDRQRSIYLGYQGVFRVIKFPIQILSQAVRQDLRNDIVRFHENLKDCNLQTRDYNEKVISYIKERSQNEFRITRKNYYVISYIYQTNRIGKISPEQKQKRIQNELYMRAKTVIGMLSRAQIRAYLLDSLAAMEVMKRALNRDRMIDYPVEDMIAPGKEKMAPFVTADVTTLPGFEDLVNFPEEVKSIVRQVQEEDAEQEIYLDVEEEFEREPRESIG